MQTGPVTRLRRSGMLALGLAALLAAGACIEFKRTSTGPTSSGDLISALTAGLWTSSGGINPNACGNFQWSIAELTSTRASGTFAATCAGGIALSGTAEGTLNGSVVNWSAAGSAQTPLGNCPFTMSGTATLETGGVRVNYTANTCVGTFSGSELLNRR